MISRRYSQAAKEAFTSCPSDKVHLHTLEVVVPENGIYYIVNNPVEKELTLETSDVVTFLPCGFRFELPSQSDNGIQEMRLQIDNVDLQISELLYAASKVAQPVLVRYRLYFEDQPTVPQNTPPLELQLSDVMIDVYAVSGRASFADIVNLPFLTKNYTRRRFPTLGVS